MICQEQIKNFGWNLATSCQKCPNGSRNSQQMFNHSNHSILLDSLWQQAKNSDPDGGRKRSLSTVSQMQQSKNTKPMLRLVEAKGKTFRCMSFIHSHRLPGMSSDSTRCRGNKCLCSRYSVSMLIAGNHCKHFFFLVLWKQGLTGGRAGRATANLPLLVCTGWSATQG